MPTVRRLLVIAIAIAAAILGATALGISAVEHSATPAPTKRFMPSKAEFRLNDHQRLKEMLLDPIGRWRVAPR